jgi:uncharacterized repeat protein (TIGR03987 family)
MSKLLILAIIAISLALVFYTSGVWAERKSSTLKKWHVVTFWIGLTCDTTGTLLMERITKSGTVHISDLSAAIHGVSGLTAIVLMIFHAVWATRVLIKDDEQKKQAFHRFSLIVWLIWLIPYFVGMFIGLSG